ncbi:K+-transporting ATPase ATPase A chain [Quadrisphaera granulorum]|uniref:Potassium-transporting ATPase potassium-binding subunit n=1 Tax=Quadrisphaera granulorum TaxID=317664 RepID=A0A316A1P6_9ACTN|nr:potassium-transporting ATPase subunit KdpA [Quadrisphaera granulorum]PWJ51771.1 K+-transporting ATPase ATPase A chain [Quadrisphaera granulorum]SZE97718.1 K+-transporting ATPase ATPase A chain [Quadrisphaera granulorum]
MSALSDSAAGFLTIAVLVVALAAVHAPLGDFMARVYTSTRHLRVERFLYRVAGIDPDAEQRWPVYARAVLGFSFVSVLFLYAFQRLQAWLPLSLGFAGVAPATAWNTAISFVTNTNWQSYSGESTMGHLVQAAGLAVQNFTSAAVGMAVAVALVRGFTRSRTERIGSFWVDLVRTCVRILLPLSVVAAVVMLLGGVVQNLAGPTAYTTIAGGTQTITGGPIASQEAIKELGTNGGGFFNANSAHPFEGPTAWVSLFQVFLMLAIPFSLPRTFGRLVGDKRHGYAVLGVMGALWLAAVSLTVWAEVTGAGAAPQAAGGAMEGKEVRFGEVLTALFGASTTSTSTGAINGAHDSLTAAGGGVAMLNMMLGEVSPGGTGSGLYGLLVLAVIAVFLAGLMVGRTPELLGKKIGKGEVTLVALYVLATPTLLLVGAALTAGIPSLRDASLQDDGAHGLSEVLYAYASASNNNGSAFAGFGAATDYQNVALALCMVFGRFVPMLLVIALAGRLASQAPVPVTAGTLPTHTPLFASLVTVVVIVVAGLTYFPALALAPIAEALS